MADVAPPSAPKGLSRIGLILLFATPFLLFPLAWWGLPVFIHSKVPVASTAMVAEPGEVNGPKLYTRHCANCHGEKGDGNGIVHLEPKARYFGAERFKLGTTTNGIPTDDDLLRVLRRGIPGSAMPSFAQLSEPELRAIIGHVRFLTRKGVYDRLRDKAMKDEGDYDAIEIAEKASKQTEPGKPLESPKEFAAATPELLAQGKKVYLTTCAPCHGPEGRGDGPQVKDLKNENGTPARPRDLTRGVFKGGREPELLYARIMLGMPGTPMPASNTLPKQDVEALIQYVLTLSPPPAPPSGADVATTGK